MSLLNKPFDLLFKHTLGSDLALQDFVRHHLPNHVYQRIDPNSIHPTKQSYVPPELKELHSDLVCTCTIDGKEALLMLLVEHQSKENWLMPLRFIKYKAAAIEDFLQGKPQATPWPIVVCACFYHGKVAPYPYSNSVHDYFTDPALAQALGGFTKFQLIDLTVIGAEEIQKHGTLALMEQVLKYSRERDFFNLLKELLERYKDTLLSLESPLGSDYWHAVYLVVKRIFEQLGYGEETAADLFAKTLDLSKTKEEIMNVTQAIKQQGMQQGLQQGLQQGMQQEKLFIARTMLFQLHLGLDVIEKATGLSKQELEQLQKERNKA